MAIAHVQSRSVTSSTGTSLALAYLSNTIAANALIVGLSVEVAIGADTITDSLTNTYANDVAFVTNTESKVGIWSAPNGIGGADTVTASGGGTGGRNLMISEYSGLITAAAFDKSASGTGFGTALLSAATASIAQADELLIGVGSTGNAAAPPFTPGASYTERLDVTGSVTGAYFEERIVAAIATYTASATATSNSNWVMLIATYKASTAVSHFLSCTGAGK